MAYIRYGNINKMFKEHQIALESIKAKYEEDTRLRNMISSNEWKLGELENNFRLAVISSLDGDGKPLHKNEQARKVAVETLLRGDPVYNQLRAINDVNKDELVAAENDAKYLRAKLRFHEREY